MCLRGDSLMELRPLTDETSCVMVSEEDEDEAISPRWTDALCFYWRRWEARRDTGGQEDMKTKRRSESKE